MQIWHKIKQLGWKRVVAIFILAAIDVFVIAVPYYLKNVIPNLQMFLNIPEAELSRLTAIIGWVTLLTQLPGGWLTDKFSSRKLLVIACVLTGLSAYWYGSLILNANAIPQSSLILQYRIIYVIWGVSSTPFFWAPLWKLVSQQTDKKDQAFAYGLQGSLNGLIGVVLVLGIGAIITYFSTINPNNKVPFALYIYLFSTLLLIFSVGIYFFVIEKQTDEKFSVSPRELIKVLQDWKIWALSVMLLGMYMFQSVIAYFLNQMFANVLAIPSVWLTVLGAVRLYGLRLLVSAPFGRIADRFSSLIFSLIVVLAVGLVVTLIIIFLPGFGDGAFASLNPAYAVFVQVVALMLFLLSGCLSWMMVTLRYAQAAEVSQPANATGAVTALMSFIGFSSDAWFYQIASSIQEVYTTTNDQNQVVTSQLGYQIIILITVVVGLVGLVAALVLWYHQYAHNKKLGLRFFRWRSFVN